MCELQELLAEVVRSIFESNCRAWMETECWRECSSFGLHSDSEPQILAFSRLVVQMASLKIHCSFYRGAWCQTYVWSLVALLEPGLLGSESKNSFASDAHQVNLESEFEALKTTFWMEISLIARQKWVYDAAQLSYLSVCLIIFAVQSQTSLKRTLKDSYQMQIWLILSQTMCCLPTSPIWV